MIRLLLARHAPTDWNTKGRFQGQEDIALGDTGRSLAALLADRLGEERIDEIQTSDLRRAWETARAVADARGLPLRLDTRLRELNFGSWQGLTYDEVRQAYPEALAAWEADALRVAPPGGETLAQLATRIGSFLGGLCLAQSPFHLACRRWCVSFRKFTMVPSGYRFNSDSAAGSTRNCQWAPGGRPRARQRRT